MTRSARTLSKTNPSKSGAPVRRKRAAAPEAQTAEPQAVETVTPEAIEAPAAAAPARRPRRKPAVIVPVMTTPSAPEATPEPPLELWRAPGIVPPSASPAPAAPAHRPDPISASARAARRRGLVAAGILVTVAAGAGASVFNATQSSSHRHGGFHPGLGPARATPDPTVPVAGGAPEAQPILADYRPPDREQVRRAYTDVARLYGGQGLSGVVRQGMDCFGGLRQNPSYPQLDYCIAFDAYAGALQRQLSESGGLPAGGGWFAEAAARDLKAAQALVGQDGDPSARLLDIRRLAGEVSQESASVQSASLAVREAASPVAVSAAEAALPASVLAARRPQEESAPGAPSASPSPSPSRPAPRLATHSVTAPHATPRPALRPVLTPVRSAPARVAAAPRLEKTAHVQASPAPRASRPQRRAEAAHRPAPVTMARASHTASVKVAHAHLERAPVQQKGLGGFFSRAVAAVRGAPAAVRKAMTHTPPPAHKPVQAKAAPLKTPTGRPHLQLASVQSAPAARRGPDGTPWIDCRRPAGSEEARICQAVAENDGPQRAFQRDLSQAHVRRRGAEPVRWSGPEQASSPDDRPGDDIRR